MQLDTADCAPVPPFGQLDKTRVVYDSACSLHYVKTWRHSQNRKYIPYYTCITLPSEEERGNI